MKKFIIGFLALIAAVHAGGLIYKWYWAFPGLDVAMHLAGGAWVGVLVLYFIRSRRPELMKSFTVSFLLAVGTTAIIGIIWEFYEFLFDVYVFKNHPLAYAAGNILFDTLKDLFDDLTGAVAAYIVIKKISKPKIANN